MRQSRTPRQELVRTQDVIQELQEAVHVGARERRDIEGKCHGHRGDDLEHHRANDAPLSNPLEALVRQQRCKGPPHIAVLRGRGEGVHGWVYGAAQHGGGGSGNCEGKEQWG